MGFALPNGSTVFVGSGLGSPVSVSTVSNAEGAVFTVAENHNLKVDDVVLISSGWGVLRFHRLRKSRSRVVNSSMHRYSFWQTIASVILAPLRRLKTKPLP